MARKELEEHDNRFHENLLKRILNKTLVSFLVFLSWLPFRVLYFLSDFMYLIVSYAIKYRYKVITENLKNSFPEKTEIEIAQIRSRFYRHFCDVFLESIKIYSISDNAISKRLKVKGENSANEFFDQGRSIVALAMHHNNWEWTSFVQSKLKHHILTIYNPIRGNEAMEKFLTHNREKWGSECVPLYRTAAL